MTFQGIAESCSFPRERMREMRLPLAERAQAQMWAGSNLDGLRLARTEQGDIEGGRCDQRCVGGARRDQHEDDEGDEVALRGPIQARQRPVLLARIGDVTVDHPKQATEAAERHHENEKRKQETHDETALGGEALHPPSSERGERSGKAYDA